MPVSANKGETAECSSGTTDAPSVDGLRGMCVDTATATKACPSSSLARQCIAARLNLAASRKWGPKCFDNAATWAWVPKVLEQCCSPVATPEKASLDANKLLDCSGTLAKWNSDKDLDDPVSAAGEGLPSGHTADGAGPTSSVCATYTKQWVNWAQASGSEACEAGFCTKAYAALASQPAAEVAVASITSTQDVMG